MMGTIRNRVEEACFEFREGTVIWGKNGDASGFSSEELCIELVDQLGSFHEAELIKNMLTSIVIALVLYAWPRIRFIMIEPSI